MGSADRTSADRTSSLLRRTLRDWWLVTRDAGHVGRALARTAMVPLRPRVVHAAPGVAPTPDVLRAGARATVHAATEGSRKPVDRDGTPGRSDGPTARSGPDPGR